MQSSRDHQPTQQGLSNGSYNGYLPHAFGSKEEVNAHLNDLRYRGGINERDPSYQAYCQRCLEMTEDSVLGAGSDLQSAKSQPHRDWQDPLNTLGGMNDIYRDMSEAHRDQSSQLYKTSAFERQRVAEKINRSVPDSAVASGSERYNGSVQMGQNDGEPGGE